MADESKANAKAILLVKFSGEMADWAVFIRCFKVYSKVYGFCEALNENGDSDLPRTSRGPFSTDANVKTKQEAAIKRNDIALASYTLAFKDTPSLMLYIDKGTTVDWEDGHAGLITKALLARYAPVDMMAKIEFKDVVNEVTMSASKPPSELFARLLAVEIKYKETIDIDRKVARVLAVAPASYKSILASEISSKGASLTIDDLEKAMMVFFRANEVT